MKTESQTRKQMEDAYSKLMEIEKKSRTAKNHYDRIVNERAWKQQKWLHRSVSLDPFGIRLEQRISLLL